MTVILRGRWFKVVRVAVWFILLVAWTRALLTPVPSSAVTALGGKTHAFWFGKTVHVGAYATLSLLTILLPFPRRWRVGLLAALVLHGAATEYLQQFVERGSSWRDWALDTLGCLIGAALGWRWLRRRGEPFGEPPQVQPHANAGQEHHNAPDLG